MDFIVLPVNSDVSVEPNENIYLVEDNWNDWWRYRVLYQMYFKSSSDEVIYIGSVKIGELEMDENQDKVSIRKNFEFLESKFFSVGQDAYYYENLNRLGDELRDEVLRKLNDIALDLELLLEVNDLEVTKRAVLRDIKEETVRNIFNNLARGNSALTEYNFEFSFPHYGKSGEGDYKLPFTSYPDSNPPTNVQAIIGRNGVGKTHLLNQMVASLIGSKEEQRDSGVFNDLRNEEKIFDNIIYLSFSAFDDAKFFQPKKIKKNGVTYTYIGLKSSKINPKTKKKSIRTKSTEELRSEFIESMWKCRAIPSKKARLEQAINMLNTDPIFAISGVTELLKATHKEEKYTEMAKIEKRDLTETEKNILKNQFMDIAIPLCKRFSSGHSIVLLTIIKLIEELEEKTLVLLDEPESHLHPPLLSTFTRILSSLLVSRNGMGIVATHSPVILQEIPKKCVWIADRFGTDFVFERPEMETFGENINTLTKNVFSFEITDSGFHKLLHEVANKVSSYEEALNFFNDELGMEAKAILRALLQLKESNTDA